MLRRKNSQAHSAAATRAPTVVFTIVEPQTFAPGVDPDLAQVDVQNRISLAQPQLPSQVTQRASRSIEQHRDADCAHLTEQRLRLDVPEQLRLNSSVNTLTRLPGVSNVNVPREHEYAMCIWLNPEKMAQLGITASDVTSALNSQNVLAPGGQVGQQPAPKGQQLQLTVQVKGRLTTVDDFKNVIVRASPDGSLVQVKDIAQVQLGSELYTTFADLNGKTSVMIGVYQLPSANALNVAKAVTAAMQQLSTTFPPGLQYEVPLNTTDFVNASISDGIENAVDCVRTCFLVVFIFLQNWRATIIPAIVVLVSLVGATASFNLLGFSLNTLTLFGLVLAVGLVVDDAIVVVEAVQRT